MSICSGIAWFSVRLFLGFFFFFFFLSFLPLLTSKELHIRGFSFLHFFSSFFLSFLSSVAFTFFRAVPLIHKETENIHYAGLNV